MQLNGFTLELVDQVARCLDDSMDDPNHFSPLSLADTLFVHIYHLLAEATTEAEVSETRLNAYTRDAVARVMTYHGEELSAEELEAADKEVRP